MSTLDHIKQQIAENAVILYMKGSPDFPQCGFSARAVNILENPDIRAELPAYANWPTFPQLYIKQELIGGSDIIAEMYEAGELQALLKTV